MTWIRNIFFSICRIGYSSLLLGLAKACKVLSHLHMLKIRCDWLEIIKIVISIASMVITSYIRDQKIIWANALYFSKQCTSVHILNWNCKNKTNIFWAKRKSLFCKYLTITLWDIPLLSDPYCSYSLQKYLRYSIVTGIATTTQTKCFG